MASTTARPLARTLGIGAVVTAATLMLSGCSSSPASSAAGATSTTSAAATAGASVTASTSATSSTTGADVNSAGAVGSGSAATTTGSACANLFSTPGAVAGVTAAFQQVTHLTYVALVPGDLYYGRCGTTYYAAVDFQATPGAGSAEQVGLQDDGSAMHYFALTPGGAWKVIGQDSLPRPAAGCAAVAAVPAALAALWHGCAPGTRVVDYLAGGGWRAAAAVYRPASVVLSGDSTLGLQAMTWTTWHVGSATGHGTGWVDDCNPSCAGGHIDREPVTVTLSGDTLVCGKHFYTRLELTWTGTVPPGLTRSEVWHSGPPVC